MIRYYDLPLYLQVEFLSLLFRVVCLGVCLLPSTWKRRKTLPGVIVPAGILLSGVMLVIYTSNIRSVKKEMVLPEITKWLSEQPVLIPILLLFAIVAYDAYWVVKVYRYRKHTISRSSIKEALAQISSGLCFFAENGRIILSNHRINQLCHAVLGKDLQNAAVFWQLLQNGDVADGVVRIADSTKPTFRLPDGTVWTFSCEQLDGVYQLTASDTTQIHVLNSRLETENRQLEEYGRRLRQYGEKADELTRSRERLEIKVRIHRKMGQTLLATRRCLQEEFADYRTAVEMWGSSIALLRKEAEPEDENPVRLLQRAASATGIELHIKGEMPSHSSARELFLQAASESLTNAITHAKAKNLYLEFGETPCQFTVSIYNDGRIPDGPITEGGGLSSLRQRVERIGGTMQVSAYPQFMLTVAVNKGGAPDD